MLSPVKNMGLPCLLRKRIPDYGKNLQIICPYAFPIQATILQRVLIRGSPGSGGTYYGYWGGVSSVIKSKIMVV
jgi:hypothetical protein